jgi:hypothetical protein
MVSAATDTAVNASISIPVCAAIFALAVMTMRSRVFGNSKVHFAVREGQGMAQGNQLARPLRRLNAGDARRGEHVAFRDFVGLDECERCLLHTNLPTGDGGAEHDGFAGHVDHAGLTV